MTSAGAIDVHVLGGQLTIVMSGEVDLGVVTAEQRERIRELSRPGQPARIDLSALRFMDSLALGFMIDVRAATGAAPVLVGVDAATRRLLHAAGVDGLFAFGDDT